MIGDEQDEVPTLLSERVQAGKGSGYSRCTQCGDQWMAATYWHCGDRCHRTILNRHEIVVRHRDSRCSR